MKGKGERRNQSIYNKAVIHIVIINVTKKRSNLIDWWMLIIEGYSFNDKFSQSIFFYFWGKNERIIRSIRYTVNNQYQWTITVKIWK